MRRCGCVLGGLWLAGGVAASASQPLYENNAPVISPPQVAPQVDAAAFVNRSEFSLSYLYRPYDFTGCLAYTNTGSGIMFADPGFRFDYVQGPFRYAADYFVNQGRVTATTNLMVLATNILNAGDLSAGPGGVLKLYATSVVDVARTRLHTGASPDLPYQGLIYSGTGYYNDPGITDLYWASWYNNNLTNRPNRMPLTASTNYYETPNFAPPFASSPYHEVRVPVLGGNSYSTYSTKVPSGYYDYYGYYGYLGDLYAMTGLYDVHVWTNAVTPSNWVVQMVFAPTNHTDTNLATAVRFIPDYETDSDRMGAVVRFSTWSYDIALDQHVTNHVYVVDATATVTNTGYLRNQTDLSTYRPASLGVHLGLSLGSSMGDQDMVYYKNSSYMFEYLATNNAAFTNTLVWNPNYRSNTVPVRYAAYGAQIGYVTEADVYGTLIPYAETTALEPTNMPGRIEIAGSTVNLEGARVRAESLLRIEAENLVGNVVAEVDAPFLIYNLGTTNAQLVVSNLAPATVRRLNGMVNAWSGVWTNYLDTPIQVATNIGGTNTFVTTGTNTVQIAFHALVVENLLTPVRPVVVHRFAAHAAHLTIRDTLAVGNALFLEATNLHVTGALDLPAASDWATTNVAFVRNLTNDGRIWIPGTGYFGEGPTVTGQPAVPYASLVNHGYLLAATHFIRTEYFENTASPLLINSGLVHAQSGLLSIRADTGVTDGGRLVSSGDLQIFAGTWSSRDTVFEAGASNYPGALILAVTNRLSDEGTSANNRWTATAGFRVLHKPPTGDLLGTHLTSRIVRRSFQALHVWPGENRGTNASGYADNLALGQLTLDGTNEARFVFEGATGDNALYVDYLELLNHATNYNDALVIPPGFTLYFANANLPVEKLDGTHDGRLAWVRTYTGPRSTTNITYPSGLTYAINLALARSKDIDSDGDGFANAQDPYPVFIGALGIQWVEGPPARPLLVYDLVPNGTNILEYTIRLDIPQWLPLAITNYPGGPADLARGAFLDEAPTHGSRFYRVRVAPPRF